MAAGTVRGDTTGAPPIRRRRGTTGASSSPIPTSAVALPDPLPGPGEAVHVLDGWIDLLLGMDPVDGHPSVTLGSTNPPPPGPPSPTYRAVLATGMAEMGLTPDEAETHLVDLDRR